MTALVIDYTAFRPLRIDAERARLSPLMQESARRHEAYLDELRSIGLEAERDQAERVRSFLGGLYEKHE